DDREELIQGVEGIDGEDFAGEILELAGFEDDDVGEVDAHSNRSRRRVLKGLPMSAPIRGKRRGPRREPPLPLTVLTTNEPSVYHGPRPFRILEGVGGWLRRTRPRLGTMSSRRGRR